MHASISRSTMSLAMSTVDRISPRRTATPILGYTLLQVEQGQLHVGAANLAVSAKFRIPVSGPVDDGAVAVPTRIFTNYMASLKGDLVDLKLSEARRQVRAKCGKAVGNFSTLPAEEFMALPYPVVEGDELDAALLYTAIDHVLTSASDDDDAHLVLTGVHIVTRDGKLRLESADGFRCSIYELPYTGRPINAIVPSETLDLLRRLDAETIRFLADESALHMTCSVASKHIDVDVSSRLIEGSFPDVQRILPTSTPIEFTVNRRALTEAVKRALIFAKDTNDIVKLVLEGEQLDIEASSTEHGDGTSYVAVDNVKRGDAGPGTPFEIAVNGRFLQGACSAATSDDIVLQMSEPTHPIVFREANSDGIPFREWVHVVMPMHLDRRS